MNEKKRVAVVITIVLLVFIILGQYVGGRIFLSLNAIEDVPHPGTLFLYWTGGLALQNNFPYQIGAIVSLIFPMVGAILVTVMMFKKPKRELHGSARFANNTEVLKAGLFKTGEKDPEILIGQYNGKYLRWSGKQFGFLAAPTRSGKGVGIVIPNCLNYRDSLIVFDPKLENFKLTSGYRHEVMKQEVFLFNPSARNYKSHCWNPMSYISRDPYRTVGDALNIANILYSTADDGGGGNAKFFAEMAQKLFLGLTLFLIERERQLKETQLWREEFTPTLAALQSLTTPPKEYKNLADWVKKVVVNDPNYSDVCKENLLSYANTSEQTAASILSSLVAPLSVFSDAIVRKVTSKDDFDLRDIRKKRMTIYLGIQPNDIAKFSRLINLFFSQLISVNTEELPEDNPELKYQCLLLIDEFAAIGKVEIIEKSVAYIAGYNLRLFPIFQNMSQLNRLYTKDGARSLSTNFECQIIYPPRDQEDAKEYSEIIGYETFKAKGTSKNRGQIGAGSESISDQRRAVMNPDELRTMPVTECIISMTGIPPIRAKKIIYYQDPFFQARLNFAPPEIPLIIMEKTKQEESVEESSHQPLENEMTNLMQDFHLRLFTPILNNIADPKQRKKVEEITKMYSKDMEKEVEILINNRQSKATTEM